MANFWIPYDIIGNGDVIGPGSSTDNAIVRYDGTTGKLLQNSGVTIDDSNDILSLGKIAIGTDATLTPTPGNVLDKFYDFSTTITDLSVATNYSVFKRYATLKNTVDFSGLFTGDDLFNQIDSTDIANYFILLGFNNNLYHYGQGTVNAMFGGGSFASNSSAATVHQSDGFDVSSTNDGTGQIATNTGLYILTGNTGGGTITTDYSIYVSGPYTSGVTNHYGLYLEDQGGATNAWSIYSNGGDSYFAGKVGFGVTSPSEQLDIFGNVKITGRILGSKGANVASANNLTLGTDGNTFVVTGVTTINGIATAGWTPGSVIYLIFSSGLILKNNTPASAGFASMKLSGGIDQGGLSAITLVYDGTYWIELSGD